TGRQLELDYPYDVVEQAAVLHGPVVRIVAHFAKAEHGGPWTALLEERHHPLAQPHQGVPLPRRSRGVVDLGPKASRVLGYGARMVDHDAQGILEPLGLREPVSIREPVG